MEQLIINNMKKTFLIVAVAVMSLSSLSTYAKRWFHRCAGGGSVEFSTSNDTTNRQASAMGAAWCDNR